MSFFLSHRESDPAADGGSRAPAGGRGDERGARLTPRCRGRCTRRHRPRLAFDAPARHPGSGRVSRRRWSRAPKSASRRARAGDGPRARAPEGAGRAPRPVRTCSRWWSCRRACAPSSTRWSSGSTRGWPTCRSTWPVGRDDRRAAVRAADGAFRRRGREPSLRGRRRVCAPRSPGSTRCWDRSACRQREQSRERSAGPVLGTSVRQGACRRGAGCGPRRRSGRGRRRLSHLSVDLAAERLAGRFAPARSSWSVLARWGGESLRRFASQGVDGADVTVVNRTATRAPPTMAQSCRRGGDRARDVAGALAEADSVIVTTSAPRSRWWISRRSPPLYRPAWVGALRRS